MRARSNCRENPRLEPRSPDLTLFGEPATSGRSRKRAAKPHASINVSEFPSDLNAEESMHRGPHFSKPQLQVLQVASSRTIGCLVVSSTLFFLVQ
jgi:hypothetical protein